ncbi:fat-like cadherin-related tumor suppressor homolog [Ctenocephalides felis]|uniref:fat-like cadherin-related tumor suppressor homolog n=1 Tax=Ctenocephalides felis TaxID=7515 RepID=UPI000E6E22E6|nr:fat-like cadherin-related tumor suppressor homolog [Ctenocephalides felis]
MVVVYADALVRVTIDDVNDNAPKFALETVTVRIREDVPLGSLVAMVDAFDPDLGAGGVIKYSLLPDEAEGEPCFRVDKKSGAIRVSKPLDFEERQLHTLTIEARDSGSPALTSKAVLIVEIVDVDENSFAPVFSDFVLSGSVSENLPAGSKVMKLWPRTTTRRGLVLGLLTPSREARDWDTLQSMIKVRYCTIIYMLYAKKPSTLLSR